MAKSKNIVLGGDNTVKINGPTREDTGAQLDNTNASATSLFRLFNEKKKRTVHAATTRLRTAVASGATTGFEIPHMVPQWLETGDVVTIETDGGEIDSLTIATFTPGTDDATPATNFDTFTVSVGVGGACDVGREITLRTKATASDTLPITESQEEYEIGDTVEIQYDDITVDVGDVLRLFKKVIVTEDGEPAPSQESDFSVVVLDSNLGILTGAGNRLRVQVGSDFAMAEFPAGGAGTPPVDEDWVASGGFSATIPDTQLGMRAGELYLVEIHFNGGAGLALIDSFKAPVTEK